MAAVRPYVYTYIYGPGTAAVRPVGRHAGPFRRPGPLRGELTMSGAIFVNCPPLRLRGESLHMVILRSTCVGPRNGHRLRHSLALIAQCSWPPALQYMCHI